MTDFGVVMNGRPAEAVIDLDAIPFIPLGWEFRSEDQIASRVTGILQGDRLEIALHLDPGQHGGRMVGADLRDQLEGSPVLPANVLDWLLDHTVFIPESWRDKAVFFWTIYRAAGGHRCVRFLCYYDGVWHWDYCWIDVWDAQDPSAVSAS